jgi:hypothetical protein
MAHWSLSVPPQTEGGSSRSASQWVEGFCCVRASVHARTGERVTVLGGGSNGRNLQTTGPTVSSAHPRVTTQWLCPDSSSQGNATSLTRSGKAMSHVPCSADRTARRDCDDSSTSPTVHASLSSADTKTCTTCHLLTQPESTRNPEQSKATSGPQRSHLQRSDPSSRAVRHSAPHAVREDRVRQGWTKM